MSLVGQFGVTQIGGLTGVAVGLGQAVIRPNKPMIQQYSRVYSHAFVVISDSEVVEAMPGGARISPLKRYMSGSQGRLTRFSDMHLSSVQQAEVSYQGRILEGTEYSFLDYGALALEHLGIRPQWLIDFIQNTGHMICSQLVDFVYYQSGIHLFDDGRAFMDVIPYDLADWQDRHPCYTP